MTVCVTVFSCRTRICDVLCVLDADTSESNAKQATDRKAPSLVRDEPITVSILVASSGEVDFGEAQKRQNGVRLEANDQFRL